MNERQIEMEMLNKVKNFIKMRYPKGWGGAAVLRTENNNYLISVAIETFNTGASLCIETGAICEAHKIDEKVTHSLCLVREDENSEFVILTPCGICQERLMYWGNVMVGVTTKNNEYEFKSLEGIQKYHWSNAYKKEELELFENRNEEKN